MKIKTPSDLEGRTGQQMCSRDGGTTHETAFITKVEEGHFRIEWGSKGQTEVTADSTELESGQLHVK